MLAIHIFIALSKIIRIIIVIINVNGNELKISIFGFGVSWVLLILTSCSPAEQDQSNQVKKFSLSEILQQEEYWEGSNTEHKESFFVDEEGRFSKISNRKPYTGVVKVRFRTGTASFLSTYSEGLKNGDFYEWHDNGKMKSKSQFKKGMRHGYFYIWTNNGIVYSRKFYQDDLEDFGKFEDDGISESGKSLAAIELEEWEGKGSEFYYKFAGDPKRGGTLFIRETKEPYTGIVTALDDKGRKEALLRFSKGKYHGTISKWDENGRLWEESEFDRGILVSFTIKNGEPFDPTQIIDVSEDPSMVNKLFSE